MRSILFLFLCLFSIINNQEQHSNSHAHTFLVKTDLTKEQIEQILNDYHQRNRNGNPNQGETTSLKHKNSTGYYGGGGYLGNEEPLHKAIHKSETNQIHNTYNSPETTQLLQGNGSKIHQSKATHNQTNQVNATHNHTYQVNATHNHTYQVNATHNHTNQVNATRNHSNQPIIKDIYQPNQPQLNQTLLNQTNQESTIQLKKTNKKEKEVDATKEPEAETVNLKKKSKKENEPKVPEVTEVTENPEMTETSEAEQTPEVNLKKKNKNKEKNVEITEVTGNPKDNTLLINEPTAEEIEESQVDVDTVILMKKNKEDSTNVQQSSSKIFGFFSCILLTIAFVSLFVYATQPRKGSKLYKKRFEELTDYHLIKENI